MEKVISYMVFLLACVHLDATSAARILGVFPHVAKSHFVMAEALMKGLAAKGHEVVVISHFPQKTQIQNYKDISLVGSMPNFVSAVPLDVIATGKISTIVDLLAELGIMGCEQTLSFPTVQNLIHSEQKFDLVINELFNTDCFAAFAHKFKAPLISTSATPLLPWGYGRFGNPDNPAYIGNIFLGHCDQMTYWERVVNTFYYFLLLCDYHFYFDIPSQEIASKYFGDSLPPLSEIVDNTSLILMNRHFTINQPMPNVPALIEVGGIHVQIPKKLPQDLEKFMNESKHGVIVFSLGSTVRSDTFTDEKRDAFLQAFSELPHSVLWKWEGDSLPGNPKNIKTAKWLPQGDVLAHPNVKAFITHGGLMGTMEAVYSGVPLVAIPLFGDQFYNVRNYEQEGVAVKLEYSKISKDKVLNALKTVLYNPSYRDKARSISAAFKDRPMTPLETAIYWTEYVIRHKGAPYMRSAAKDLSWYQHLLLDVAAFFLLVAVVGVATFCFIIKQFIHMFRSNSHIQKSKTN